MPSLQPPDIGNVTTTQDYESFCGEGSTCEKVLFQLLKIVPSVLVCVFLLLPLLVYIFTLCPSPWRKSLWNSQCCCCLGLVWFVKKTARLVCWKNSKCQCCYAMIPIGFIDEAEFEKSFKHVKCSFPAIFGDKSFSITEKMYDNTPELITKGEDQHRDDDDSDSDESEYETTPLLSQQRSSENTKNTKITEKFPVNLAEDDKRLTAIVGIPGSGKSVYMEILRHFYIFKLDCFPFLIKFRELKKVENEMTFPEFLFKYYDFSFSKDLFDDKKNFGKWIEDHTSKILILLDGLDEYHSKIDENVSKLDMNESATVDQWISLLLKKDGKNSFLSGIKVVFTSRPSTFNNLPESCRPMVYYKLSGFTDASIKSVINLYNSKCTNEIFSLVKDTRSNFGRFARNPFMLVLISSLYGRNYKDKFTSQTTLAELYNVAFEYLRRSKLNKDGTWNDDKEKILDGFWYKLFEDGNTLQSTVAYFDGYVEECNTAKGNDQKEIGVTLASLETFSFVEVQSINLLYGKPEPQDIIITPKHRTIQEFHVARHILRSLNLPMFISLVQEQMYQDTYDDKWMMIRRFLSYFIINLKGDEDILNKKEVYVTFFCEYLIKLLDDSVYHIYKHLKDHEEKFIDEILKCLKENNILIWYKPNHVDDQEGRIRQNPVNRLLSFISEWNDNEVGKLFRAISQFSRKIEYMVTVMIPRQVDPSELVKVFPHFTRKLMLWLLGDDDRPQFCIKLMKEIINFDTSKLQTQELKVEVVYYSSTILLEVVIRPGEPLQFTKVDIHRYKDDEVREFFQTIQRFSKNDDMEIWMNAKQDQCLNELVEIFPHLTKKLKLLLVGDVDDRRQRFCRKLAEEIINFDTSKLQTQELKVEVVYNTWGYATILLEVVIRRGEPLQFNKVDIHGYTANEVRELFQTIKESKMNEYMMIKMNAKQHQYINELVATFPHLTRKLKLELKGEHVVDRRQFCRKLTEEIINFDTSKLQTQELEVEVVDRKYGPPTILLEVVIRRGEPLQFTKVYIIGYKDDEVREFFQTIQRFSKNEDMEIGMVPEQHQYMKELVATFPHLTRKLKLQLYGYDGDRRRFCTKLTEEIINFDTSQLQTQELKVEVRHKEWLSPIGTCSTKTTFLEVVIRRGEPLQFITQVFN